MRRSHCRSSRGRTFTTTNGLLRSSSASVKILLLPLLLALVSFIPLVCSSSSSSTEYDVLSLARSDQLVLQPADASLPLDQARAAAQARKKTSAAVTTKKRSRMTRSKRIIHVAGTGVASAGIESQVGLVVCVTIPEKNSVQPPPPTLVVESGSVNWPSLFSETCSEKDEIESDYVVSIVSFH